MVCASSSRLFSSSSCAMRDCNFFSSRSRAASASTLPPRTTTAAASGVGAGGGGAAACGSTLATGVRSEVEGSTSGRFAPPSASSGDRKRFRTPLVLPEPGLLVSCNPRRVGSGRKKEKERRSRSLRVPLPFYRSQNVRRDSGLLSTLLLLRAKRAIDSPPPRSSERSERSIPSLWS